MAASDAVLRSDFLTVVFRSDYSWLAARLRYKLGCRHNAEDVACETFTQLAAMPTPQDVKEPRAMLTTIANRVMYELSRRRDLERAYMNALALMPAATHPSPEDQHLLMESLLAVDKALEGLPVKARMAFLYSQIDGLTYAEIASRLGVSASMVRQYMAKALKCCYLAASE
ncbi:sigma-70 family RNA polymerase sigma factor [Pseudomonas kitaguniensis]|uniref:sigma-70 family RNA polymerase sigma factor n=1 Tax=Pseudomonas kitaguniensis TaxID=2607908 RepID=UPI003CFC9F37